MRFSVIIIDDEFYSLKDLESLLSSFSNLKVVATFRNALDAILYLTENGPVDIVFCDIVMPKVDGLEAGPILSKHCTAFVFTTGHPEYAIEGYGKGAKEYLLKPIKRIKIEEFLKRFSLFKKSELNKVENDTYFLKDGSRKISQSIRLKDILYIVSYGNYIKVVTADSQPLIHNSLKSVEIQYEHTGKFIRIHRSTIVAKSAIRKVSADKVFLLNGEIHAIGKTYRAKILEFHNNNLFISDV